MNALMCSFGRSTLSRLLATALLVGSASATTYVVDVNGGFDFTDIQSAIDASSPGDVILVHPGSYAGFTMSIGITLVGAAGVDTQDIHVTNVSAGSRAGISSFRFRSLSISACTKPVLVSESTSYSNQSPPGPEVIRVENCSDVRLRNVQVSAPQPFFIPRGADAAHVSNARVEITSSSLAGSAGMDDFSGLSNGGPGSFGVSCDAGSDVHISLSTIHGGRGGDSLKIQDVGGHGGNGAAAISVQGSGKLLITGRASDVATGGRAGYGIDCQHDGSPGPGLSVGAGSYARASSVTFQGGAYGCDGSPSPGIVGLADIVTPIDPSLELTGDTSAGQVLTFVLRGTPGDSARIRLGRQAIVQDQPDSYEDLLTNPLRIYDLGALPASGQAQKLITIPGSLPEGYLMVFQGSCVGTDGVTRLTQSAPVIVK